MRPPNLIFVPDADLMNRLIELVAREAAEDDGDSLLIKFCDFSTPKPEWMLEQDRLKKE